MKNSKVKIIAGPCSIDPENISEIYEIASMTVKDNEGLKKAIYGTRIVGLKSRTVLDRHGNGMGMDYGVIKQNLDLLTLNKGYNIRDLKQLPSMEIASRIVSETGLLISTEVMLPAMQMTLFQKAGFPKGKLLCWNPAVNQLGWQIMEMGEISGKNGWDVGLKNPKWLGETVPAVEKDDFTGETSLEKTWKGLASYASSARTVVMIHRGVDVDSKGNFRNIPIHKTAKRTKNALIKNGQNVEMFFDPSHSYGPKMRGDIPQAIIDCLKIKTNRNEYLYDGILVESGTSKTDQEQHISLDELRWVIDQISKFRDLAGR